MQNNLYYLFGDTDIPKVPYLPFPRPRLEALLREENPEKLTLDDLQNLWSIFREVEGYLSPETLTLKEFAAWVLEVACEVTW